MIRNYSKWDDEPRSVQGVVESVMRAHQIASTQPYGPTYVCLDVALQEQAIEGEVKFPDVDRFAPGLPPAPAAEVIEEAARLLVDAKQARDPDGPRVAQRSRLAGAHRSRRGARCGRAHRHEDIGRVPDRASAASVRAALPAVARGRRHPQASRRDPVARLDRSEGRVPSDARAERSRCPPRSSIARSIATSTTAGAWTTTACRRPICRSSHAGHAGAAAARGSAQAARHRSRRQRRNGPVRNVAAAAGAAERADDDDYATSRSSFASSRRIATVTIPTYSLGWPSDTVSFNHPLDYLGFDTGGGVGSGPGNSIGAALALKGSDRLVLAVIGDGDYAMASNAFWTAAHMEIPLLVVVANNRSYYNDVAHQERMAVVRNRPVANKFIGQEMNQPTSTSSPSRAHGIERRRPGRTRRRSRRSAQARRGRGARRQDLSDRCARRGWICRRGTQRAYVW